MKPSSASPGKETGKTIRKKGQDKDDPILSSQEAKGYSLKDRKEWKQVHSQGNRQTLSQSLSQSINERDVKIDL